jgi:TolB-like protein
MLALLLTVLVNSSRARLKDHLWPGDTFVDSRPQHQRRREAPEHALNDSATTRGSSKRCPSVATGSSTRSGGPVAIPVETAAEESSQWGGLAPGVVRDHPRSRGYSQRAHDAERQRDRIPGTRVRLPVRSVAVLPFENHTGNAEQEYSVDGLTWDLTSELSKIKQWSMPSWTSAMTFKHETKKRLPEIARELDAELCVVGSVQRSGDLLLIDVHLMDRTDDQVWGQTYQRDGRTPHILQLLPHEIARDLVRTMRVQLSADEQARLTDSRSLNQEAHDTFLKGLYELHLTNAPPGEARKKAEELFLEAAEIDPAYAPAFGQLALLNAHGGFYLIGGTPRGREATREFARQALERDAGSPRRWLRSDGRYDGLGVGESGGTFPARDRPEPQPAGGRSGYAEYLSAIGRHDDAIRQADYAMRLDQPFLHQSRTPLGVHACRSARRRHQDLPAGACPGRLLVRPPRTGRGVHLEGLVP